MTIAYVLGEFPVLSETFVRRELEALTWHRISFRIYACRHPVQGSLAWQEGGAFQAHINYYSKSSVGLAHRYWILRNTHAYLCALRVTIQCHRHHPLSLRQGLLAWRHSVCLGRQAARDNVRHVHAHFGSFPASVALSLATLLQVPFSVSVHARDVYVPDPALIPKIERASFIVACHEQARAELIRRSSALANRILLVHHGVPLMRAPLTTDPIANPPLILAVGRLVSKKGFKHLLAACQQLKARRVACRVAILGGGVLHEALKSQIQALGLNDSVELVGEVPSTEVWKWYARASVVVVPSEIGLDGDHDGIPNVVIEALACRRPVVATKVGGIPEVIEDGVTGLLVPPADPAALATRIQWLLENPEAAASLAEQGFHLVEANFDQEKNAQVLAELFRGLDLAQMEKA